MPIKILTTADLHLGRTSSESEALPEYGATRSTWEQLVEWAIDEDVQALLLAGDLVEHDNRYFEAATALDRGLAKLEKAGIAVVMVAGNHDYDVLPAIMKDKDYQNVHLLGENGKWEFLTLKLQDTSVQFAGWSFPKMHVHEDPFLGFPADKVEPNLPTIGLIHGDYGAVKSSYAPLDLANMSGHNVTAWVMGHIHKAEVHRESEPLIFYPGSPHALSPKERGIHGGVLLTVDEYGVEREALPFSPVRYEEVDVDISELVDMEEVRSAVFSATEDFAREIAAEDTPSRLLVCDVYLSGAHEKVAEIDEWIANWDYREITRQCEGLTYSIRTIDNRCTVKVADLSSRASEPSPAGVLAQALIDLGNNKPSDFLRSLQQKLRKEVHQLNTSPTYIPLRDSDSVSQWDSESEEEINTLLERECHRLLSALLSTKKEG